MRLLDRMRRWALGLKEEAVTVALAARDPRTPWLARLVALAVVAYGLSPIDLIPDFIPLLGHLDDLVIVPAGLWLAIRLIPPEILAEHRARAATIRRRASRAGLVLVVAAWVAAMGLVYALVMQ